MRLRELLLASGEWDWSAMGMRAEGGVWVGVEWMLAIAGVFVAAVDGSCLGISAGEVRRAFCGTANRSAHTPRRNCADNEQSDGSDGRDRRTACADQACEVEVVADAGYLRCGMTEFL